MRKPPLWWTATALTMAVLSSSAFAQEPIVFPSKGQSNDQMEKDKYSCYQWAKGQTNFDPMQAPKTTTSEPKSKSSGLRGAAGGAAAGAAIGAIAGDAGKGAALGAASGGIIGGARKRQSEKAKEQEAQARATGQEKMRSDYNRAWGACMEGKGYTVK